MLAIRLCTEMRSRPIGHVRATLPYPLSTFGPSGNVKGDYAEVAVESVNKSI